MTPNMILQTEKTGDELSFTGNNSSSNSTSETILQEAQSIEAEADYPHGIRLVFVVIALILSMFLVCLQSYYDFHPEIFLTYLLGCFGYGMSTI